MIYESTRESLREDIRRAFLVIVNGRCGLDGFGDYSARAAYTKKPTRDVELDGYSVSTDAEPVRASACRTYKNSKPLINDVDYRLAPLVRAINKMPHVYHCWLKIAYGDKRDWQSIVDVSQHAFSEFLKNRNVKKSSLETCKKMAFLALMSTKQGVNGQSKPYTNQELADLTGKKLKTFEANWLGHWKALLTTFESLDKEALDYVYQQTGRKRTARLSLPKNLAARGGKSSATALSVQSFTQ